MVNDRQRRFAELLLQGMSATQAYRNAGFSKNGANRSANALLRKPEFAAYLAELRAKAVADASESVQKHLAKLAALGEEARAAGRFAAAITAEKHRGEVLGYYITPIKLPELQAMSDEQLTEVAAGEKPRLKLG